MQHFSRAFTLVEFLIMVSIIAILLTLLMPALKSAIDTSRVSSCSNNLRQQSLGHQQYADDHFDFFVQARTAGGWPHYYDAINLANPKGNRIDFLTDYLYLDRKTFSNGCVNSLPAKAITNGVLSCPSRTAEERKVCGSSPNIDYLNNGEAMVNFWFVTYSWGKWSGRDVPIRRNRFLHPSSIFHLCDGIVLENGHNETTPSLTQVKNAWYGGMDLNFVYYPHSVNCYAAYDGHVSTLTKEDVWKTWSFYKEGGTGADSR